MDDLYSLSVLWADLGKDEDSKARFNLEEERMTSSNMQEARELVNRTVQKSDASGWAKTPNRDTLVDDIALALSKAEARGRLAENEACAKVADARQFEPCGGYGEACQEIAQAIRQLKGKS